MNHTNKLRYDNAAISTARLVTQAMNDRLMSREEAERLVALKTGTSVNAVHAFAERGFALIRSGWA